MRYNEPKFVWTMYCLHRGEGRIGTEKKKCGIGWNGSQSFQKAISTPVAGGTGERSAGGGGSSLDGKRSRDPGVKINITKGKKRELLET